MVSQFAQRSLSNRAVALAMAAGMVVMTLASACDKMPLLAPSGTVITILPAATTIPLNGEIEIVATVIENGTTAAPPSTGTPGTGTGTQTPTTNTTGTSTTGAGTPVQNGTLVSFTTTIGRIEPREARTQNGEVRVRFLPGGQSGIAVITAYSGGASGKSPDLMVGTAAVDHILVTASPQTLGPAGGAAEVQARVEDARGAGLVGVPVAFSADNGQLSASIATTDQDGIARTRLTTTQKTIVTAAVGAKTATATVGLLARTGVKITGPANAIAALTPASFTVGVSATANVRDVTVNFGDGRSQSLGPISGDTTVPHIYAQEGNFIVTATATDASGFQESASTGVTVLPAQPPSVRVDVAPTNPGRDEVVNVTATVSGNTSSIIRYEWNFGSDATPPSAVTSGNTARVSWSTQGTKLITVRVVQASGPAGDGFGTVTVRQ